MKRVVVTGMGIWSCIGQDLQTVTESLRQGRSGIGVRPERKALGYHSLLSGIVPRTDARSELETNRYESPDNWHSWNDFFARKLRSELRNPVIPSLPDSIYSFTPSLVHSFLSPLRR